MILASWNVNGLRSCLKKGLVEWITEYSPDIICLQEIKSFPDQIIGDKKFLTLYNQYEVFWAPAQKKGYSGVAIFSRKKPLTAKVGIKYPLIDQEGRTLILEYPNFFLLNCYFPHGRRDQSRIPYKMTYCHRIEKVVLKLEKIKPVIICGDFNIAPQSLDLKNPKANENTSGFLPIEKNWVNKFMAQGFHDIFRETHLNEKDHYTWWTYRHNCRKRNIGWRIDYFLISKTLKKNVKRCYHQPLIKGSDHCPVILEIKA